MPFLLYFGHVNTDIFLRVGDFGNVGESREVYSYFSRIGGTAYNAYRGLRALNVPSEIFSVVGPNFEEDIEGHLVRDERAPTCWIITNGQEQMAYVYQGLWNELHKMDIDLPVEKYEYLHFSTGNPKFYVKIAREARDLGKKIAFDPSQEIHYVYTKELFEKMLGLSDIFFCNVQEYQRAREYAPSLLEEKIIVRTEGSRGASFYTPQNGWIHVSTSPARVVDTTGAGDTFRAGFYAALYRGHDILGAVKYGNLAARMVVESSKTYYDGTWESLEDMGNKI